MQNEVYEYMNWPRIEAVVYAEEQSPRDVMGPRITKEGVLIQGFFPDAECAAVIADEKEYEMSLQDEAGYFAVMLPLRKLPEYSFKVKKGDKTEVFADPYAFPCQITEAEEKAFLAGVWYEAYTKLGSHPMTINGVSGTLFAVWAPNARRVSLVGDFNNWDGRCLPMHRMPKTGIFELFVPGIDAGTLYQYEMLLKGNVLQLKADPYAQGTEKPQGDASAVAAASAFAWKDTAWMEKRASAQTFNRPFAIYETSLSGIDNVSSLVDFAAKENYTHVELHPAMEYMDDDSDGYPSSALFAVSARYGGAENLKKLINGLHEKNIGVILDWNAAQFPRIPAGLCLYDGTPLYEPADPKAAVHPLWNTMLYNYASPMVTDYLLSNACYWAEEFHVDGLRLDDVDAMLYLDYGKKPGEYTPNIFGSNENLGAIEFLKHFNSIIHKRYPGFITVAQEDGLWPQLTGSVEDDCIGFDYKWSGGWTGDFLSYLQADPIMRGGLHDQLTLSMLYAYSEHYILTLGSRDVGKLADFENRVWGSEEQKKAQVRAAYAYMYMHPGCKMSAPDMGAEGEFAEFLQALNSLYIKQPALSSLDDSYDGFEWIQLMKSDENVLTFLRKTEKPEDTLLVVCNFSAVDYPDYQTGVPFYGKYKEILNTDDAAFGGKGFVNPRAKTTLRKGCDERDYSLKLRVPALSVCVFSCTPAEAPAEPEKPVKKAEKPKAAKPKAKEKAESPKKVTKKVTGKKAESPDQIIKKKVSETVEKVEKALATGKKTRGSQKNTKK